MRLIDDSPLHSHRLASGSAGQRVVCWLALFLASSTTYCHADPPGISTAQLSEAAREIRERFHQLDRDRDERLNETEFLRREAASRVLKRDFKLYDFDSNGTLDAGEFASVSGLVAPHLRGSVPDPFDRLLNQAVAALDESYDGWNRRPGELVNAHTFVANFLGSISLGNKRFVTGRILRQADQDSDGRMSRSEAKHFLQLQLGMRWLDGPPLREPTGRLLRLTRFLAADRDQSESLNPQEFAELPWNESTAPTTFHASDLDGNGQVSFPEFADPTGPHFFDPVEWFRSADTNLDGLLQRDEAAAAGAPSRHWLIAPTYAAFDRDHDGALTLQQYRLSMHGNVNYFWDRQPTDSNGDGHLGYDEFVFDDQDLFQLQRRYYFHRHDLNADGVLTLGEFPFRANQAP